MAFEYGDPKKSGCGIMGISASKRGRVVFDMILDFGEEKNEILECKLIQVISLFH